MKTKVLAFLLAALLIVSSFAACGGSGGSDSSGTESSTTESTDGASGEETAKATGPDDTTEPYEFTVYCNYDWWAIKEWGADEASKFMKEKFNVDVNWTKPDADPAAEHHDFFRGSARFHDYG